MVYSARRLRESVFGPGLFADPEWDLILDLYIAQKEGRAVSATSACIGSAVPSTTALRHLELMEQRGLVLRSLSCADARLRIARLSSSAAEKLEQLHLEVTKSFGSPLAKALSPNRDKSFGPDCQDMMPAV